MPEEGETQYTVYLVDYGAILEVGFEEFYVCSDDDRQKQKLNYIFELPPQCFQCRLSEVIPSPIKCPSGWSEKSTEVFKDFITNKTIKICVNSFVDHIASVILFALPSNPGSSEMLNEELVLRNFAQASDDSYMCLLDHNGRRESERRNDKRKKLENELVDNNVIPPPEDLLVQKVTIDGPYSPLECNAESLSRTFMAQVLIEASSVNSVLFDPYPNDSVKKLLVAASLSKREDRVTLHQTTIMPHLPGMACLLGLMFSPISEVRLSNKKSRYMSILTGLGCDEDRKPFYGEHDCLIYVDVVLDQEDFNLIDNLRGKMSVLMHNQTVKRDYNRMETTRNQVCTLLMEIAKKQRSQLGINMEQSDWNWKSVVKIEQKDEAMYPPLVAVDKLSPLSERTRQDLINHAKELVGLAATNARDEIIWCQLCEERIETVMDLKLHVLKKLHKDRNVIIRDECQ